MPIVGTAGHVDHGKSTLVEALTGRDPDRWAAEKERGLTIDLGFAWTNLHGIDVGFVDVPGHERFIKNMLAGVGAVDCALLVVAADSGWMPQTEEHASVLDLLETRTGVIAITRIDLVDEDTVEIATLEVLDEIEGTALEGWPIVPVSAVTGAGLDSLTTALAEALAGHTPDRALPLRMWIDRAFSVSGAGLVVTGTIAQGSVRVGDEIEVLPDAIKDRVRGIHHHDQPVSEAAAGDRTAINLQASHATDLERGDLLCAPGSMMASTRVLATLTPARKFEQIPRRGAFHVHAGTGHAPAAIRRLPGSGAYVMTLEHAMPFVMGDRIILRDTGRRAVVGGGRILDPNPPRRVAAEHVDSLEEALTGTPEDRADALVAAHGSSLLEDIRTASGGAVPSNGVHAGDIVLSNETVASVLSRSEGIVESYHSSHPLRPGIQAPELASQMGVDLMVLDAVLAVTDRFETERGSVRLAGFTNALTANQEAEWAIARNDLEASFDVPRMSSVALDDELLHALIRRGDLVQIAPDLVFTSIQIETILNQLPTLPEAFSVGDFRDTFGMTRRQAVPTLEWLDKTGRTRRSGDTRTVRP